MIKTIIIGCGSVGSTKNINIDSPTTKNIFTHAHAITANKDFELVGLVDKDINKAYQAAHKWGLPENLCYCDIKDVDLDIDLAVVAVDTKYHKQVIEQLIRLHPKTIICEKPCTENYKDCDYVVNLCRSHNIKLVVNYSREFVRDLTALQIDLINRKIQNINIRYCRGFKRDACHALAFILPIVGGFKRGKILRVNPILDNKDDLTLSAFMSFDKCDNVILQGCNGDMFSIFEITILTDSEKIDVVSHGKMINISISQKTEFGEFKAIENITSYKETDLIYYLKNLYEDISADVCLNYMPFLALEIHKIYKSMGLK